MNNPIEARERRPPPRIPGYLIQGVLGSGATSVVYRAVQLSIERTVAMKVLHAEALRSARAVKRLQREARTAARLKHPNIISAIDMGRAGDTWWFAMELVEGDALAELLDLGGRFTERRALDTFIPLCGALQYASEHGVVHRDVKPANILIEADGRPRLVDLGLARVQDDPLLTRTGATLGTPHYISPEQARDPASADVRSDIWSIGASLFHTVCGRPPFEGESAAEILSSVLYGRIPDPRRVRPDLSRGLSLVLRKCLSRDRERRYFTPRELMEDLERVRERKAPAVKLTQLEPLDPRGRRTNRRALAAAAGLVAVLVLLVAWRPWQAERGGPPVTEPEPWPELAAVSSGVEQQQLSLAAAWTECESLCRAPRAGYEGACETLRESLVTKLSAALRASWSQIDLEIAQLSASHAFDDWELLLDEGVGQRVRAATGFELGSLPKRFAATGAPQVERRREDLKRARDGAVAEIQMRVKGQREMIEQRFEVLIKAGGWDAALASVELSELELVESAGADARGFDVDTLARALTTDLLRLQSLALDLERRWRELDAVLSAELVDRFDELESDLNSGRKAAVSSLFEDELVRRLIPMGLDLNDLPQRFEAGFVKRYEKQRDDLARLEDELLQKGAEERLAELDREAQPLRLARNYEALLQLWREKEDELELRPRRHSVELRREEAMALSAFLEAAAAGIQASDGEQESLRVSTLKQTGVVRASRDVSEKGFELEYPGGRRGASDTFLLRRPVGRSGPAKVLAWQDLERFGVMGSTEVAADELALRRVLFRFSEGAAQEALDLLKASELDDEDYLVYDVRRRLGRALNDAADEREELREEARHAFRALTSRPVEGSPVKARERIDRLIEAYDDVLNSTEKDELLARRREIKRGPEPATLADFIEIFGTEQVRFEGDEVELRFEFDVREVGAFDPGTWHFDGIGWMRSGHVSTLEELAREDVPTLKLRRPLDLERGPVEVDVRFFQPKDSPTDLFVLSAGGYHFAVARGRDAGAPVCVLAAGALSDAIRAARAGEGAEIEPLELDAEHRLKLVFNRSRRLASAWVDGVQVAGPLHEPPGASGGASLSFRSLEPLRLREVSLRGERE